MQNEVTEENHSVPAGLCRLVAELLPTGYHPASTGGKDIARDRYFHVADSCGRRRTFSYDMDMLDSLYSEIRKLAVEVRRIEHWRKKNAITEADIDRLASHLCSNLPKTKGTRWGKAEEGFVSSCCQSHIPAGCWWIHEDSAFQGSVPEAVQCIGSDKIFTTAHDFARYLIELKENRFERVLTH
ncbi:hypothetical protein [Desulfovibrio inopinatus]|uniref:hypothetical protein n=1 Tax=Desulfovibrio inopinatus TaxID=102109 RepID=UPI00040489F2|nr:hypothetical protein [Desulfovibrio inopinatus]